MTSNPEPGRELTLHDIAERFRPTWLIPHRWQLSRQLNPRRAVLGGWATVFQKDGGFCGVWNGNYTEIYTTEREAQIALWEMIFQQQWEPTEMAAQMGANDE